jgi:succinyl-diaminopimelate desuccinylase
MWSKDDYEKIFAKIESLEREMVGMQEKITAVPALAPTSGGEGEAAKSAVIEDMVKELKPDEMQVINAPDDRVPSGGRPSIIAKWHGKDTSKTIWIMAHMDIVPTGPAELWDTDPFEAVEKDGKLYGRGVEDNQQSLVASFYAVKAMLDCGLKPTYNVALLFVADEETGSEYGVGYLVKEHDLFKKEDVILVPDGGVEDGSMIEVAEKSILWLKVTVTGKQAHGSMPAAGNNAHRAGARLLIALDEAFHKKYTETDPLFDPPESTFEPTKKEVNVESVNIIPGEDVFYFDCRVLPPIDLDDVEALAREQAGRVEKEFGVKVEFDSPQRAPAAPPTATDAEVVRRLSAAIKATRGIDAKPQGIGGGTVAAFFRRAGLGAAVWGTIDSTMHQPNEYCVIANMVADANVYAHIFGQE